MLSVKHSITATAAAAVMLGAALTGTALSAGDAAAANPPTINVGFAGSDDWKISWDGTGSPGFYPTSGCFVIAVVGGTPVLVAAGGFVDSTVITGTLLAGQKDVGFFVTCETPTVHSNTVHIYAPRGPVTDARTTFSNATQGMFGS